MKKFYSFVSLLLVAVAALFTSCESDEVYATIQLAQTKIYFAELNDYIVIPYTGSDIVELTYDEDDLPDGWEIVISRGNMTVTVYGPTTQEDFDESLESTSVSFYAISKDGNYAYEYLTLGTTDNDKIDITDQQANCFIVTQPNTIYVFNATSIGENQATIAPSEVSILWKTTPSPISYTRLVDDTVEFHVSADEYDYDGDDLETDLVEGNAVIAAYDDDGEILWTWHIWTSEYDEAEREIELNGVTLMTRNLGANNNSTYDYNSILGSYGMYYQWGRKDPFVGPLYYNASGGSDAVMYNESLSAAYISYEETTSTIGVESYLKENPLIFALGVEDSSYDYLYSDHSSTLWGETKTINDPCPKGWRVASPEAFSGLMIPTLTASEIDDIADDYGWELSDSAGNSALFMGLGRRTYLTGKIHNYNLNENRPAPWVGYYWTTAADSSTNNSSYAMYFAFDQDEPSNSTIQTSTYYRANGMQVRCQKVE
ncbi:MAG: hypothetical protein SNG49_06110 [Rikenellaceae bacterium]